MMVLGRKIGRERNGGGARDMPPVVMQSFSPAAAPSAAAVKAEARVFAQSSSASPTTSAPQQRHGAFGIQYIYIDDSEIACKIHVTAIGVHPCRRRRAVGDDLAE